jgi:hypothetical protein
MSQITIVTTPINSGQGTPLATAFNDCNSNFSELYARYQVTVPASLTGSPGDKAGMYASDSSYYYYCFKNYDGVSTIWAQVTQVANVVVSSIQSGNSNVRVVGSSANVTVNINGTSNVATFATTGVYARGVVSTTGNVTGNYILGNGSQLSGLPATYTNANVIALLADFGGNVIANTGNITGSNITGTNLYSSGVVSAAGNVRGSNLNTAGVVSAAGNIITNGYFVGTFFGNVTGNFVVPGSNTQIVFNTSGNADAVPGLTYNKDSNTLIVLGVVSGQGNVIGGNVNTAGQVVASGNVTGGNFLTGGQVSAVGNVTGASLFGTIATATQNSITSVGTLGSLNVTGNVQAGNLRTAGQVSALGNVISGNVITTAVAAGGNVSATGFTGTSVSMVGNVRGGNILTTGYVSATGNVAGGYFIGNGSQLTGTYTNSDVANLLASFGSNVISTTGSITGGDVIATGNLSTTGNVVATGNISGGNVTLDTNAGNVYAHDITLGGMVSAVGNISTGANVVTVGTVINSGVATTGTISATGNITGGNVSATNYVGTTASVTGNITGGNVSVGAGTITVGNIRSGAANLVGTIGTTTSWFGNAYLKAVNALYADLAEVYASDSEYSPGTVVVFGGTAEITITDQFADVRVAGAISTDPAYLMNSTMDGLPVALRGRVPVKVIGPVRKGDLLVTAGANPGYAISVGQRTEYPLAVFAKSIETNTDEGVKTITAVII